MPRKPATRFDVIVSDGMSLEDVRTKIFLTFGGKATVNYRRFLYHQVLTDGQHFILMTLINKRVVTESYLLKRFGGDRGRLEKQIRRFVNIGYDIKRKEIAPRGRGRYGNKKSIEPVVIYYI